MLSRKAILIALLLIILHISGCNASDRPYASVSHVYSADGAQDYYSLFIAKPTDKLSWGHEPFDISYVTLVYSFNLPSKPKGRVTYPAKSLFIDDLPENFILSGQIIIDLNTHIVYVSLITRDGDFQGNGEYPLTDVPSCEHFKSDVDVSPSQGQKKR